MNPVERVLKRLDGVKRAPSGWVARCPCPNHGKRRGDRNPSLSVAEGDDGRALLNCFVGCELDEILGAIGLTTPDLFADEPARKPRAASPPPAGLTLAQYAEHVQLPIAFLRKAGLRNATYGGRPAVAIPYRDASGKVVETKYRTGLGHDFRWPKGKPVMPYGLPSIENARRRGYCVLVEGESDTHVLRYHDLPAIGCPGAKAWKDEWAAYFDGIERVYVFQEPDDGGETFVSNLARSPIANRCMVVSLGDGLKDARELHRAFPEILPGMMEAALAAAVPIEEHEEPSDDFQAVRLPLETSESPMSPGGETTIGEVIAVIRQWLYLPDSVPLYAALGAVAANRLPGDPVWLGLVAPPSSAKTEILGALSLLPDVHPAATLTPAGLLSGTPKKQKASDAKGGLLRLVGEFGILVLKDFGSILSMRPDAKAEALAALREIYDGSWTRVLGTDGGRILTWKGKVGLLFGATPALDDHHAVIGAMGERFVMIRMEAGGHEQAERAFRHRGAQTAAMRQEMAEAVAGLLTGDLPEPRLLEQDEKTTLIDLARKAVLLRSHVVRDRYSREIENIHGAEGPARLALILERLLAGLDTLGLDRTTALETVRRVALDSVPPIRRRVHELVVSADGPTTTKAVAEALGLPTNTTRRTLEDLAAYGLVIRAGKEGNADLWEAYPQYTNDATSVL